MCLSYDTPARRIKGAARFPGAISGEGRFPCSRRSEAVADKGDPEAGQTRGRTERIGVTNDHPGLFGGDVVVGY